jgi:hypothetical protein
MLKLSLPPRLILSYVNSLHSIYKLLDFFVFCILHYIPFS